MDKETTAQFNDAYVLIAELSEKIAQLEHKLEILTLLVAKKLKGTQGAYNDK